MTYQHPEKDQPERGDPDIPDDVGALVKCVLRLAPNTKPDEMKNWGARKMKFILKKLRGRKDVMSVRYIPHEDSVIYQTDLSGSYSMCRVTDAQS